MPALKGFTSTVMKDTALEILAPGRRRDPLLAFWPVGLGRAAVFTSDVKNRWGASWLQWKGYGPFFSAVVHRAQNASGLPRSRSTSRPGPVRGGTRSLSVALEARDAEGQYRDLLHPAVRIRVGSAPLATSRRGRCRPAVTKRR